MLSLKRRGLAPSQGQDFEGTWQALYSGICFTLRKEMAAQPLDDLTLLAQIDSHMNFLQLK